MSGGLWFFFWNTASWTPGTPTSTGATRSIFIVDPRFMTWAAWTAQMFQSHVSAGTAGIIQGVPEKQWKTWADLFVSLPINAGRGLPRPEGFRTWQEWAFRLNGVLWVTG